MKKNIKQNLKIISQIEKSRSKNNINWMNILRIALKSSPKNTIKILKKINHQDNKISNFISEDKKNSATSRPKLP